jgi:hypothetical protein
MTEQMRVEEVALLALTIVVPLVALFVVLDTVRAQFFGTEQPVVDAEQQRRDADDLVQLADRLRQRRHARPQQQQQQQGNAGVIQDCVVCLEELGGGQPPRLVVELIPCSHELHSDCATELVQSPAFARSGALCPTCRARTLLFVPSFERHPNHADAIAALPPPLREFNRRGGVPTFAAGWSALNYAVTHFRQLPWRAQARRGRTSDHFRVWL